MQFARLQQLFEEADLDGDGVLSRSELAALLLGLGIGLSREGAALLLDAMDEDADGRIDYSEFLLFVADGGDEDEDADGPGERDRARARAQARARGGGVAWHAALGELSEFLKAHLQQGHPEYEAPLWQLLLQLFRDADADGSGALDRREFREMLVRVGLDLEDHYADALLDALDANGDGQIDYGEFLTFIADADAGGDDDAAAADAEEDAARRRRQRQRAHAHAHAHAHAPATWSEAVAELATKLREQLWLEDARTGAPKWKRLRQLFVSADEGRRGRLSRHEFRSLLGSMGVKLSTAETAQLLAALDRDGDGKLDYHEFLEFITAGATSSRSRAGGGGGGGGGADGGRPNGAGASALARTAAALSPKGRRAEARARRRRAAEREREQERRGRRGGSVMPRGGSSYEPEKLEGEPELLSAQVALRRHCSGLGHRQIVELFEREDADGSGFVTVPLYRQVMELIGGRYPLKKDQHIAVLANFSSNDHGDGIRRVRYRPLVRFVRA